MGNKFDIDCPDLNFDPNFVRELLYEKGSPCLLINAFGWEYTPWESYFWSRQSNKDKLSKKAKKRLEKMLKMWEEAHPTPSNKEEVPSEFEANVHRLFKRELKPMTQTQHELAHATIGIATESGELLDALKKHWVYEQDLDADNIKEEIGDLLFYLQALCATVNTSMQECMDLNVAKLKKRYPEGYTNEAAKERADKVEETPDETIQYCELEVGEVIQEGDECFYPVEGKWAKSISRGKRVGDTGTKGLKYRRRIK